MDNKQFSSILDEQIKLVKDVLGSKKTEYAPGSDPLANFVQSAHLQHKTLPQAVTGKMAKHTVSIYDMVTSGKAYPLDVWNEKITDHINYLILLKAAIIESQGDTET